MTDPRHDKAIRRSRLVKFRTRRFRGNAMDVAAKSVATSPMTLSAAEADDRE